MQAITPAAIAYTADGTPRSTFYDDIYHSASGGLEQAEHVFIAGNNLPTAWQGNEQFVVLETGFGIGLNFLATWRAWRNDAQRCRRLHFVSVEKHPFSRADLIRLQAAWPELSSIAGELQAQWPPLTPGVHRLLLDNGNVTLTLLFGDATTQMRKLGMQADALFLDGFAPTKNPELWDKPFLKTATRLCKPNATLATWTVSAAVREALISQRWTLKKRPGFGSKRDMLCARLHGKPLDSPTIKQAIVIGAGIAGSAITERLAARGWNIDLIDRHAAPAREASGNPVGLLHPMIARDDNLAARLSRAGFLYSLRLLTRLETQGSGVRWDRCGILQLARDAVQEAEQRDTADALRFPAGFVSFVDRSTASSMAHHDVAAGGWFYPDGAIIDPPSLCHALLQDAGDAVTKHFNNEVAQLHYDGLQWTALDATGTLIASAPVIVLANAFDATQLLPQIDLPISRMRGQITLLPDDIQLDLPHAICGNGYVTPAGFGRHCIGATFDMDDDDTAVRDDGHRFNLERLGELLPQAKLSHIKRSRLGGRVGFRTMAIDRMPIVGALPDTSLGLRDGAQLRDVARIKGLYGLIGLGARGLSWGPLAAELLAAQLNGEPLPLERDIVAAIDPGRFAIRTQRRAISAATTGPADVEAKSAVTNRIADQDL